MSAVPERVFLDDEGKWWIAEGWNDAAKCYVPESRLLAAEARVNEVEAVVREVCPIENNEDGEDGAAYICINDNGDPFIEAETLGEAVKGIVQAWEWCQRKSEAAEARVREVEHDLALLSDAALRYGPEGFDPIRCIDHLAAERDALVPLARYALWVIDTADYERYEDWLHQEAYKRGLEISGSTADPEVVLQARAILAREGK